MFDAALRRHIDPWLERAGRRLALAGIRADHLTLGGLAVGLLAVPALAGGAYAAALAAVLLNRLSDGLDGAVARQHGASDFGGYLDIVGDFIFYASVPFGFALADPGNALAAAFLIFSFVGTGSSFLAYAIFAAKHGLSTDLRGRKSIYYLGGLTEGAETIALFVFICLFPAYFIPAAYVFGALCWLTTATRMWAAYETFARNR